MAIKKINRATVPLRARKSQQKLEQKNSHRAGFTMVELLATVTTIGLLGTVAMPQFADYRNEAKQAAAAAIEGSMASAIKIQMQNTIMRCNNTNLSSPSIASLRANNITAGGDCGNGAVSPYDRRFLDSDLSYPPVNPVNGLNTIGLATDIPGGRAFIAGTCSTVPGAEPSGWCYNPSTGQFWASTNSTHTSDNQNSNSSSSASSASDSSASNSASSQSESSSSASSVSSSASSASSSSSVASSASSASSVSGDASSASSAQSSSVSSGGGGASSSSSVPMVGDFPLYSACEEVPEEHKVIVQRIRDGYSSWPEGATFSHGGSEHFCICKPQSGGFSMYGPSTTGVMNGNGHSNSFFIMGNSCDGSESTDDENTLPASPTGPGSSGEVDNLLAGDCTIVEEDLNGGGSVTSLIAAGRIYDSGGTSVYTVWKIRNSSGSNQSVVLKDVADNVIVSFTASANTDNFVRSPTVGGTATHKLYVSGALTSTKAASNVVFTNDSTAQCVQ